MSGRERPGEAGMTLQLRFLQTGDEEERVHVEFQADTSQAPSELVWVSLEYRKPNESPVGGWVEAGRGADCYFGRDDARRLHTFLGMVLADEGLKP